MNVMFNIFIQVESEDLQSVGAPIASAISAWVEEKDTGAHLLDERDGGLYAVLGINIQVRKTAGLKEPLRFLFSLAKEHKCDFVLGVYDGDAKEEVCYFGHEEGKPDVFEIANYVGLQ